MARLKQKWVYRYRFSSFQLEPMLEAQPMLEEELESFSQYETLVEKPIKKKKKDIALSIVHAEGKAAAMAESPRIEPVTTTPERERKEMKTYTLTYYNPETNKTEVLITKTHTRSKDFVKQMIEESVGMATAYRLYSYIATPVATKKVVPHLLEKILNEREYDTPPPFGGVAVVKVKVSPKKKAVVARAERSKAAVIEVIRRKEAVEEKLEEELILLHEAVETLRKGKKPRTALKRLGPLTRARFLALLKQKEISPKTLLFLLEKDIQFLEGIKKKLQSLTTVDLLDILAAMRVLKDR